LPNGFDVYTKTILLTEDRAFERAIKQLFLRRKVEVSQEMPLLSDIETVYSEISRNRSTVNIRGEFGFFIKTYGLPYLLILDYMCNFGRDPAVVSDKQALVRALLFVLTVVAQSSECSGGTANVVFIVEKKYEKALQQVAKNPLFLLDQIRRGDDRCVRMIDSFAADENRVKNYFRISYLLQRENARYLEEVKKLERLMDGYDRLIAAQQGPEGPQGMEMIRDSRDPADVLCRATLDRIMVNGVLRDTTEEEREKYEEKDVHLVGSLTESTMPTVLERVLTTFNEMAHINPFKKDGPVAIRVPDASLVDGSFASSLGIFLSNALSEYRGIRIYLGKKNLEKVRKSPGFIALQGFIDGRAA
jgi:hypothetical protein